MVVDQDGMRKEIVLIDPNTVIKLSPKVMVKAPTEWDILGGTVQTNKAKV